jgi:hypothetical protein
MQKPPAEDLAKALAMIETLRSQLKPLFEALPGDPNTAVRFEAGEEQ